MSYPSTTAYHLWGYNVFESFTTSTNRSSDMLLVTRLFVFEKLFNDTTEKIFWSLRLLDSNPKYGQPSSEMGYRKESIVLRCKPWQLNTKVRSNWLENLGTEPAVTNKIPRLQRQYPFLLSEFEGIWHLNSFMNMLPSDPIIWTGSSFALIHSSNCVNLMLSALPAYARLNLSKVQQVKVFA